MIIDLSIANFGPIKDKVTLSFEPSGRSSSAIGLVEPVKGFPLLRYALIYGANASGKSTILKALDLLLALVNRPLDKKNDRIDNNPFKFSGSTQNADTFFELRFVSNNKKYGYSVSFNSRFVTTEHFYEIADSGDVTIFTRRTDKDRQLPIITFAPFVSDSAVTTILSGATLWNNTVFGGFQKVSVDIPLLRQASEWFLTYCSPIIDSGKSLFDYVSRNIDDDNISKSNILSWLRNADLMIDDINIEIEKPSDQMAQGIVRMMRVFGQDNRPDSELLEQAKNFRRARVDFHHITPDGQEAEISYEMESDGTQRFYQLAGVLDGLLKTNQHFSIDELDASLHPDLVEFFLETYLSGDSHSQLIATMHQRDLFMNSDIINPDALWITQKNGEGATELYSLSDFDDDIFLAADPSRKYYEAYRNGQLGGKPFLGVPSYNLRTDDATE